MGVDWVAVWRAIIDDETTPYVVFANGTCVRFKFVGRRIHTSTDQLADRFAFRQDGDWAVLAARYGPAMIDVKRFVNRGEKVSRLERSVMWIADVCGAVAAAFACRAAVT